MLTLDPMDSLDVHVLVDNATDNLASVRPPLSCLGHRKPRRRSACRASLCLGGRRSSRLSLRTTPESQTLLYAPVEVLAHFRVRGLCYLAGFRLCWIWLLDSVSHSSL
jgi:hypothetical protein